MPSQSWAALLNSGPPWQTTTGAALSTISTGATISPQATGPKDFSIQPWFLYPGAVFRVTARGLLTTTAVSTTATIFLAAGVTPTTLAAPNGITTGTTVLTGIPWEWISESRVTAIASSGNTISTQGKLTLFNAGAALAPNPSPLTATSNLALSAPNASGEQVAAVDTSVSMPIMLRGSLVAAAATIQCAQFFVESLD